MYIQIRKEKIKESQHGCGRSGCGGMGHSFCQWGDAEYEYHFESCSIDPIDSYWNDHIIIFIPNEEIGEELEKLKDSD